MIPTVEAYTAALPWYEPADFAQLLSAAQDRDEMPCEYGVWRQNAVAVIEAWLAKGRAIEIVTVRPGELQAWLGQRGLPNTAETRRRYVEAIGSCGSESA